MWATILILNYFTLPVLKKTLVVKIVDVSPTTFLKFLVIHLVDALVASIKYPSPLPVSREPRTEPSDCEGAVTAVMARSGA